MARSAAARDGVSVGDWLTRRIYTESHQEVQEPRIEPSSPNYRNERDDEALPGRDEIMRQLASMETATESAFRRIDETSDLPFSALVAHFRLPNGRALAIGTAFEGTQTGRRPFAVIRPWVSWHLALSYETRF